MSQIDYRTTIAKLLEDSPITTERVIENIRELLAVGEEGLAFDTLCEWIYEDSLPITAEYHGRLAEIADDMEAASIVDLLRELISNEP